MKSKRILLVFLVPTLIIACASSNYSQKSDSTTAGSSVGKAETVSFLINQVEAARALIAAQENRIGDLENEVAVEKENAASVSKSYELAQSEIVFLKQSNEALNRAVAVNENTIAILQADNAKQREKAKKAVKDKWKAYAVAVGAIALKLIIP